MMVSTRKPCNRSSVDDKTTLSSIPLAELFLKQMYSIQHTIKVYLQNSVNFQNVLTVLYGQLNSYLHANIKAQFWRDSSIVDQNIYFIQKCLSLKEIWALIARPVIVQLLMIATKGKYRGAKRQSCNSVTR